MKLRIAVAGWALVIWLLIYLCIAIFVVYQALPNKWVPSRNNQLIFGQIKYVFTANMVANFLWLLVFLLNSVTGFALALLVIITMLATNFYIMRKTCETKVDIVEFVALRIGFTIYTGWVTAATIIGVSLFLASLGMKNPNAGLDETTWAVIILYVALVIYILASYVERNPLYGAIYIWVLFAIKNKQATYPAIQLHSTICLVIVIIALIGITGLSIREKMNGTLVKGLFYKIDSQNDLEEQEEKKEEYVSD